MWIGPPPASRGIFASSEGETARRLRRHADDRAVHSGGHVAAPSDQIGEPVQIGDEPPLAVRGRLTAEPGVGVEDRQQRQADARRLGRRGHARRDLGDVVIRLTRGRIVQIVELAHPGEAALQHLQKGQGGDRLDLFRPAAIQKTIHQRPPAPEVVVRPGLAFGAARLGQAGHRPLKGVAVQISQPGQGHAAALVAGVTRDARLDPGDPAIRQSDPNALRPSVRQQGGLKPEAAIHRLRLKGHWTGPRGCDQYV